MPLIARVLLSWGPFIEGAASLPKVAWGYTYRQLAGPTLPDKDLLALHVAGSCSAALGALLTVDMVGLPIRVWFPTVSGDDWSDTTIGTPSGAVVEDRLPLSQTAVAFWESFVRGHRYKGRISVSGIPRSQVDNDTISLTWTAALKTMLDGMSGLNYSEGIFTSKWNHTNWSQEYSPQPYDPSTVVFSVAGPARVRSLVGVMRRRRPRPRYVHFSCLGEGLPPLMTGTCHCAGVPELDGQTIALAVSSGPPAQIDSGGFVVLPGPNYGAWEWILNCATPTSTHVFISVFALIGNDLGFTGTTVSAEVNGLPGAVSTGVLTDGSGFSAPAVLEWSQ